jgi:RNA polymerase sigma factor (TIGR02999 family)
MPVRVDRSSRPMHRMPQSDEQEITEALAVLRRGAPDAMEHLLPLVYRDLRRIAHRQLAAEPAGHTLSTTALVHEAYLRLADQTRAGWVNRAQFFALAARTMRRILVDYARRNWAQRRGGPGRRAVALEDADDAGALAVADRADELLALDEALERLAAMNERQARIVEYRFYGGMSVEETADALKISPATVKREWATARAWLNRELQQ